MNFNKHFVAADVDETVCVHWVIGSYEVVMCGPFHGFWSVLIVNFNKHFVAADVDESVCVHWVIGL